MGNELRRARGAVLMGLAWGVVWTPIGQLLGMVVDPEPIEKMWVPIGFAPGLLCGLAFSALVGIIEAGRRFDDLSPARSVGWGALAGLMVGSLPFVISTPTSQLPIWQVGLLVVGPMTVLGALSGAASLALVRRAEWAGLSTLRG